MLAPFYGLQVLLPLLSLPVAKNLVLEFQTGKLHELPQRTAQFSGMFGGLLAVSLFLPTLLQMF